MEHYEKLKEDLAAAQQEVETLRVSASAAPDGDQGGTETAAAQVPTRSTDPSVDDSGNDSSVADQVAAQVAQLRQELENQHTLSKQQLESEYNTRTENMKKQLNQKLREGREKAREEVRNELVAQHSDELQKLNAEHETAMENLREEHRQIVERLTREGAEAVEKAKASARSPPAASHDQPSTATEPQSQSQETKAVKPEEQVAPEELAITDAQARELVQKNQMIRGILQRNIQNKVSQESTRLKEEHDKAMQERIEEGKKEKEKAVNMETMKQKAKLGMAENQLKGSKAKLDVVETAAKDTPQKPVVEVWEIVKLTKAPPAAVAPSPIKPVAAQPQSPAPAQPATTAQAPQPVDGTAQSTHDRLQARQARFGTPTTTSSPAQQAGESQSSTFGQASYTATTGPSFGQAQEAAKTHPTVDASTQPQGQATTDVTSTQQAQQPSALPSKPQQAPTTGPAAQRGLGNIPRGASMLPRGGIPGRGRGGLPQPAQMQAQGAQQQNQITPGQPGFIGQSMQRGGMQSGLPRGGGIPRGGAMRGGRGGGGQGGPASPMNGGAKQFVPGNAQQQGQQAQGQQAQQAVKRAHDGANPQGDEKRMRGGGPSA